MAEVWFKHTPLITFHDPLAAALIFAPDLCGLETGKCDVHYADDALAGLTRWKPGENGSHRVALTVDATGFFDHFFHITGG